MEDFLKDLYLQCNSKTGKPICGVIKVEGVKELYFVAYAQMQTYKDWQKALSINGGHYKINVIETLPEVSRENDVAHNIDVI